MFDAVGERLVGLGADRARAPRSSPPAPSATGQVVSSVRALKIGRVDLAQALELGVAQDRLVDHELARVLGRLVEQVALGADARARRSSRPPRAIESIGGFVTCAKSCLKYE